jgi:hypothetical protein
VSDEGYYPVFHQLYDKKDTVGVTNSKDEPIGIIQWREDWGCYVFFTKAGKVIGPAFMAAVLAEMIRREAERRKKVVQQLPNVQTNEPAGTLAVKKEN